MNSFRKGWKRQQNTRPVRSSQLITTWGIGSVQPFPNDDSFMLLGLDAWDFYYSNDEFFNTEKLKEHTIIENRLARRLNVKNFRKPIIFDENNPVSMPYVRFPAWHICPKCGFMKKLDKFTDRNFESNSSTVCDKRYEPCKSNNDNIQLVPSRFILICQNGHIEDFPYEWWIKKKAGKEDAKLKDLDLRLTGGSFSSTILQMKLKCEANDITVPLSDIYHVFNSEQGYKCNGAKPWLGIYGYDKDDCDDCDSSYTVTYRNALNVHSKVLKSAISIPSQNALFPKSVLDEISLRMDMLTNHPDVIDDFIDGIHRTTNISISQLKGYIENEILKREQDYTEIEFRNEEYQILQSGAGSPNDELFFAESKRGSFNNKILNTLISSVSVVHRLTETNAFVGFTRLVGGDIPVNQSDDDIEALKSNLSINQNLGWLPAYQSKGEGIFIDFNAGELKKWSSDPEVQSRLSQIELNHNKHLDSRDKPEIRLNPTYPLIHSFSHLLIEKLSYHSGYSSASIKEKIYTSLDAKDDSAGMNGILIYTIGGGDGSLGGLSNLADGDDLEKIIIQSLIDTVWCSSDPICIQSEGQGNGLCNLAACHNCLLLPETCCESFNILLDRKLLNGGDDQSNCGYFGNLIKEELENL